MPHSPGRVVEAPAVIQRAGPQSGCPPQLGRLLLLGIQVRSALRAEPYVSWARPPETTHGVHAVRLRSVAVVTDILFSVTVLVGCAPVAGRPDLGKLSARGAFPHAPDLDSALPGCARVWLTDHVFHLQGRPLFQQRVARNFFLLLELFDPCVSCGLRSCFASFLERVHVRSRRLAATTPTCRRGEGESASGPGVGRGRPQS
jgi:hypothetical protein